MALAQHRFFDQFARQGGRWLSLRLRKHFQNGHRRLGHAHMNIGLGEGHLGGPAGGRAIAVDQRRTRTQHTGAISRLSKPVITAVQPSVPESRRAARMALRQVNGPRSKASHVAAKHLVGHRSGSLVASRPDVRAQIGLADSAASVGVNPPCNIQRDTTNPSKDVPDHRHPNGQPLCGFLPAADEIDVSFERCAHGHNLHHVADTLNTPCRCGRRMVGHTCDMSQLLTPLARKLREALAARGLTQADVVRAMPEASPAAIGHWFTGRRQPQLDHLRRLAEILDVSAASLVAEDPDYAHTSEEKIALRLLRNIPPEMRQAMLALLQAQQRSRGQSQPGYRHVAPITSIGRILSPSNEQSSTSQPALRGLFCGRHYRSSGSTNTAT